MEGKYIIVLIFGLIITLVLSLGIIASNEKIKEYDEACNHCGYKKHTDKSIGTSMFDRRTYIECDGENIIEKTYHINSQDKWGNDIQIQKVNIWCS